MEPQRIVLRSGDERVLVDRIVQSETRSHRGNTIPIPHLFYRFDDGQILEVTMRGDRCIHNGIVWEPVEND